MYDLVNKVKYFTNKREPWGWCYITLSMYYFLNIKIGCINGLKYILILSFWYKVIVFEWNTSKVPTFHKWANYILFNNFTFLNASVVLRIKISSCWEHAHVNASFFSIINNPRQLKNHLVWLMWFWFLPLTHYTSGFKQISLEAIFTLLNSIS